MAREYSEDGLKARSQDHVLTVSQIANEWLSHSS